MSDFYVNYMLGLRLHYSSLNVSRWEIRIRILVFIFLGYFVF